MSWVGGTPSFPKNLKQKQSALKRERERRKRRLDFKAKGSTWLALLGYSRHTVLEQSFIRLDFWPWQALIPTQSAVSSIPYLKFYVWVVFICFPSRYFLEKRFEIRLLDSWKWQSGGITRIFSYYLGGRRFRTSIMLKSKTNPFYWEGVVISWRNQWNNS